MPWLILIQRRLPQFFQFFFIREHLLRFLTKIEDRYHPWWWFIPILLAGVLPWLLPALRSLGAAWRDRDSQTGFNLRRFAWVWCVVIFVFFSASHSKLLPYILPMFPALALLMATTPLSRLNADLRATGVGMTALGALLLAAVVLLPLILNRPSSYDPLRQPYFLALRARTGADGPLQCGWRNHSVACAGRWHSADPCHRFGRLLHLGRSAVGRGGAGAAIFGRGAFRATSGCPAPGCTGVQRAHV